MTFPKPNRHRPTCGQPLARLRPTVAATLTALAALSTAALVVAPLQVAAQPTTRAATATATLNIPAQALPQALAEFARQSGLQLVYAPDLVQGKQSASVVGGKDARTALADLLLGTGLQARQLGTTWAIERAPTTHGAGDTVLPVVRVSASQERETATGTVAGYVARSSSTGSKIDTPTREIPQSMSVVTRDSLNARGISSLADALEYVPGFTGLSYGHDDRYDWSSARGIGETYSTNFRDGLKEAGSVYAVPRLNTYGVERVEYLRGPASLLFGSAIPGGAVNSITKRPTKDTQGELRLRGGDAHRLGFGGDVSGPLNEDGGVLYRLVVQQERFDLPTPGAKKEERYFAPALTFRLSGDTELTLLANVAQDRIDGDAYPYSYYEPLAPEYIRVEEKGWDRFNRDQASAGYLFDHQFSNGLSFHSRGRYSRIKLDYRVNFADSFVSDTVVNRYAQHIKDDAKVWQTDNYVEARWTLNGWVNTTLAGVDISRVRGAEYRGGDITSPYDMAAGQGIGAFVAPALAPAYIATNRQVGVYAQNQTKIDDRFVVVLGGRRDRHHVDVRTSGTITTERSDAFTGRIGGVWLAPAGWSPYVSYATSFQPQAGVDFNGERFEPTTGRQYEVGVRYEPPGANVLFSAALFDILQQNVLVTDPLNTNFSVQRGQVGSRGLELEVNASLTKGLDLTASYSYTDAKVTKDTDPDLVGRKNGSVPAHKAAAWLSYSVPNDLLRGMKVGVGARYSSKVPDFDNTRWVPGVTLFDARLGYQLDQHWELAVNARNLFDRKFLVNCSYGSCYPGDRRELVATAAYRW